MSGNSETSSAGLSTATWGTLVIVVVVLIAAAVVFSVVNGAKSPVPQLSAPAQAP